MLLTDNFDQFEVLFRSQAGEGLVEYHGAVATRECNDKLSDVPLGLVEVLDEDVLSIDESERGHHLLDDTWVDGSQR